MRDIQGRFVKGNIEPNRHRFLKGNQSGVKHGLRSHPLYWTWRSMRNRCLNSNSEHWTRYGGRGIKITKEWNEFINFYNWGLPRWKDGLQIDRINNNGNYEPDNCRFVTNRENANNKGNTTYISFKGEKMSVYEASKKYGIVSAHIIWNRLRLGWNEEEAILTPKRMISHRSNYAK